MRERGSGRPRITRARQFVQRRKALPRVVGVLLAIPAAVAAFYVILLSWSTLMRVRWVNDRSRQFTKTANHSFLPRKIAGTRLGRLYFNLSVLHHVGRRSGRTYATPLGAYPFGDGFVLAVAYDEVDWCRNVLAAGKCTLTWMGKEYALETPELIPAADALEAYPLLVRLLVVAGGMKKFLWLHRARSEEGQGADAGAGELGRH
jgi:deazaflavin-dependent oxidoreductase (nitroreductase family)